MTLLTEFLMDRRTAQSVAAKDCRSTTSRKQLKLDKLTGSSQDSTIYSPDRGIGLPISLVSGN